MQIFGFDIFSFLGGFVAVFSLVLVLLTLVGAVIVFLFWKTRRIFLPRLTLGLVSGMEAFVKPVTGLLNIEGDFVDRMVTHVRNTLYRKTFAETPVAERVLFLPQCLRSPDCPARLSSEGILCINCGKCGAGALKELAESMGYRVFIAPGSSLIKRMVKKYRPRAVVGVGCSMEVKEGTAMMESHGIPAQSVMLTRDGCVDTRVDIFKILEILTLGVENRYAYLEQAELIASRWRDHRVSEEERGRLRESYYEREKSLFR